MSPSSANIGFIVFLGMFLPSDSNLNLYMDEKETFRLLGIPDAQLYYVRNGIRNKYALTFNMPIGPKIDSIFFTWQNLRPPPPEMFYKMRFKVSNPTAMDMPKPSIPPDGIVPNTLSTFKITFPCTGAITTEVDVNIQMNISIFSASNVTVLDFRRKKFCTKVDTYLFKELSTPSLKNFEQSFKEPSLNIHNQLANFSHSLAFPPVEAQKDGVSSNSEGTSTHIFYIAVGCVCALIILAALAVAFYYISSQKANNRAYAERISDTSSSQALTQQTQSFLRAETPNKSVTGSGSVRSYPRGISPIPELRPTIPTAPIDAHALLSEIAIQRSRISLSEVMLEGTFGKVYSGTLLSEDDKNVADQEIFVKTITDQARSDQVQLFLLESCMMKSLLHPNIHPVIGACLEENLPPYIIYPYTTEGNLKKFLQQCRMSDCNSHYSLSTQQIVYMAIQIIRGVQFLHKKRIVHKDIATRNCVVESDLIVKITDNSLARDLFPNDYNCLGDNENRPVKWLAIEAITHKFFSPASDVWAFGVTLWELITLSQQPYHDIDPFEMAAYLQEGYRLAQPINCPDELYHVMGCCWGMNPEERPKFSQLLSCLQDFYTALVGCLIDLENVFVITRPDVIPVVLDAGNGEPCSSDSNCTEPEQFCKKIYNPGTCDKGLCTCMDGYKWETNKCKSQKQYGDSCTDEHDKCDTGFCSNGKCSCSGGLTYKSELKLCLDDGKKILGEACHSAADCYTLTDTVTCDMTCKCKSGYVSEDNLCRAPHVGEECVDGGITCTPMIGNDSSRATETCQTGICKCPSSSRQVEQNVHNKAFIFCVYHSETKKEDGAPCTENTSCRSYFCGICPGDSEKTCLSLYETTISGASRQITFSFALVPSAFLCLLGLKLYL